MCTCSAPQASIALNSPFVHFEWCLETLTTLISGGRYISNGKESPGVTWEPTFTQHGFRYIEVHGFPGKPSLSAFESWEMHTAVVESGSFSCSSELINQIQSNCQWTARSNLMSIPTDCCQRNERRGWMGGELAVVAAAAATAAAAAAAAVAGGDTSLLALRLFAAADAALGASINVFNSDMHSFYSR
jgi:hypothetical protein